MWRSQEIGQISKEEIQQVEQKIKQHLRVWVPQQATIFESGAGVEFELFWSSSIRLELDYQLRQKEFLDRAATEDELDLLVSHFMKNHWPEIHQMVKEKQRKSDGDDSGAEVGRTVVEGSSKLRRHFLMKDVKDATVQEDQEMTG